MKWTYLLMIAGVTMFNSNFAMADDNNPVGWHWYNENPIKKLEKTDKNENSKTYQVFLQLTPSQQLQILQHVTTELRDKAVLTGNVADIANYKRAQDMWVSKATAFTVGWQRMLLENPNLNYSLQYSHENALAPLMQQHEHQLQNDAIANLAKHNGLLVFYRDNNKIDLMFLKLIKEFSEKNHISVLFSEEGDQNTNNANRSILSNNHIDNNFKRAHSLGVYYFPAVLLVNPKSGNYKIVSYGYLSQDELASRLLSISNNWKPDF